MLFVLFITYISHSLKHRTGGTYSKIDPSLQLVYSDTARRGAQVRPLNEWQNLERGDLEDENDDKNVFLAIMSIFSPLVEAIDEFF